jgi:hypothetical protein
MRSSRYVAVAPFCAAGRFVFQSPSLTASHRRAVSVPQMPPGQYPYATNPYAQQQYMQQQMYAQQMYAQPMYAQQQGGHPAHNPHAGSFVPQQQHPGTQPAPGTRAPVSSQPSLA